jgi:hypothetical protein
MQRYARREEKETHRIEVTVYNPLRILWATIMNRHRGSKEKSYKATDLVKLSFDMEPGEAVVKVDFKAVIQRLGKTFKKIPDK